MAIYNGGITIVDFRQTENSWSGKQTITSPSYQYGKVEIGVDGESGYVNIFNTNLGKENNRAHLDMYNNTLRVVKNTADGGEYVPLKVENERVVGSNIEGAVWNDLSDSIPVDDDCELEHGYCYCFNGEKYTKSSKYLDEGIIGIHSDTYGFRMGVEEGKKKMDVAVAGFVLAYVDREYKPGTPLTCTENGYLTEIKREDKIEYPERIVAIYWKSEPADEWGSDSRKVKVNGRKWVKVV